MTKINKKQYNPNSILDGSGSCPLQYKEAVEGGFPQTKEDWELYGVMLEWKMWWEMKNEFPEFTAEEFDRHLDYEYRIKHHNINKKYGSPLTDDEWTDHLVLMERHIEHLDKLLLERKKNPVKTHVGYELGAREFTLTYSPDWYDDDEARKYMQRAIDRLCNYYSQEIVVLHARGEVGKNGMSHVHCYYELKGGLKMTDKNFKRAYPRWDPRKKFGKGFQGGHHETVKSKSSFIGYINEDAFNWLKKDIDNRSITNVQEASVPFISQETRQ